MFFNNMPTSQKSMHEECEAMRQAMWLKPSRNSRQSIIQVDVHSSQVMCIHPMHTQLPRVPCIRMARVRMAVILKLLSLRSRGGGR